MAVKDVFQSNAVQTNAFQGSTELASKIVIQSVSDVKETVANTTFTMTMPSGITAGDMLIAVVGTSSSATGAVTLPGDWTLLQSGTTNVSYAVYYKVAVGADTATATLASSGTIVYRIMRITGYDPLSVPVVSVQNTADDRTSSNVFLVNLANSTRTYAGGEALFAGFVILNNSTSSTSTGTTGISGDIPDFNLNKNSITSTASTEAAFYAAAKIKISRSGADDPPAVPFNTNGYFVQTGDSVSGNQLEAAFILVTIQGDNGQAQSTYSDSFDSVIFEYENLNTDYGTEAISLFDEVVVVAEDALPEINFDDVMEDTDWDWDNWSWSQAPPIPDFVITPEDQLLSSDGSGLDDQDQTDFTDYGFDAEALPDDNNPEVAPSNLDDQDFTDTADYGFSSDQVVADNNPDVAPSALDDQDFTDQSDYGSQTDQPIDDNNPEIAPSALDDQDFTDDADYGSDSEVVVDDVLATIEDFILGTQSGLDEQDFTDDADYGFSIDPLSGDVIVEDPNIVDGSGLDYQDFTDLEEYSFFLSQPINDNNPDVAPSALDDQDFTVLDDYNSQTDQAIDDNNPEVAPSALDDQDFTDTADYGFASDPVGPDNNPESAPVALDDQDFTDLADYGSQIDQAIGDNNPDIAPSELDSQDFTDQSDYSSYANVVVDDFIVPQDFILGIEDGSLIQADFYDLQEYSWVNPPDYASASAFGFIFTDAIQVLGSETCQIEAVVWNIPTDPATTWSSVSKPSTSWSEVGQPSNVWTQVTEPSNTWTEVLNVTTTWTQVC